MKDLVSDIHSRGPNSTFAISRSLRWYEPDQVVRVKDNILVSAHLYGPPGVQNL